jgi:hypothetical protein
MNTIQKSLLSIPLGMAVLVACGQQPQVSSSRVPILGGFEATFDPQTQTAFGNVQTQGVIAESNVTFGTATFTDTTDTTTNTRYLKAVFPVTNNTASAISNLTLYAFHRSSANAGGTGMRSLTNFVGTTLSTDAAQAIKPTHGMTTSSTLTTGQEDFQAFQSSELTSIKTSAVTNGVMTSSDTVLEYGYVARYCTANCSSVGSETWSRTIPANSTGRVTIAYKLPNASVNSAYKFTASFVLSSESTTRVTRSREETTNTVQTRATALGATQVVLVGSDTDTSSVGTTIRLSNLKTSTIPNYLYPAYNITLQYSSNVSSSFQADFGYASSKWEDIITADITAASPTSDDTPCNLSATGWTGVTSVDDVIIYVDVKNIDGAGGTLAQAGPCVIRNSGLPVIGVMQFDSSDFVAGSTLAKDTILHEMGHVLGIGTLWGTLGITTANTTDTSCDANPRYTGTNGLAEWTTYGGAGNIPLETTGGTGTCEGHWKESNFDTELMTGYADSTVKLSRMTIGALKDIGYSVNYAFADAFSPVSLSLAPIFAQQQHDHDDQHIGEVLFTNPTVLR